MIPPRDRSHPINFTVKVLFLSRTLFSAVGWVSIYSPGLDALNNDKGADRFTSKGLDVAASYYASRYLPSWESFKDVVVVDSHQGATGVKFRDPLHSRESARVRRHDNTNRLNQPVAQKPAHDVQRHVRYQAPLSTNRSTSTSAGLSSRFELMSPTIDLQPHSPSGPNKTS